MGKVEIKNLLYQPLPIMLADGSLTRIKGRKKKYFQAEKLVEAQINSLKNI